MAFSSEEHRLNFGGDWGTWIRLENMEHKINFQFLRTGEQTNFFRGTLEQILPLGGPPLIISFSILVNSTKIYNKDRD